MFTKWRLNVVSSGFETKNEREGGGREKETLCNEVFVDAEDGKEDTEQQRHLGLMGKVLFSH